MFHPRAHRVLPGFYRVNKSLLSGRSIVIFLGLWTSSKWKAVPPPTAIVFRSGGRAGRRSGADRVAGRSAGGNPPLQVSPFCARSLPIELKMTASAASQCADRCRRNPKKMKIFSFYRRSRGILGGGTTGTGGKNQKKCRFSFVFL